MKYFMIAYLILMSIGLGLASSLFARSLWDRGFNGTLSYIVHGETWGLHYTHNGANVIKIERLK